MTIKHNASKSNVNRIDKAGDYKVKVSKFEEKKSKKGEDMLVVTFMTADEKRIDGYYLKGKPWAIEDVKALKVAAGLSPTAPIGQIFGAELGIAVVAGKPKEDGSVFMQIRGYGSVADLDGAQVKESDGSIDEIPF